MALQEAFLSMSMHSACFINEFFFKAKLMVLGVLSSSGRLSGFPDYQTADKRNFVVRQCTFKTCMQKSVACIINC
jgi:hypothetical protein